MISSFSLPLTVVIPTHNPSESRFRRVLEALSRQTLSLDQWDLVIVDNLSDPPVRLSSCLNHIAVGYKIVLERRLGLTSARHRGVSESTGELIVFVDDDNVLSPYYLENILNLFYRFPSVGAAGGRNIAEYEELPPDWYDEGMAPLGCQSFGEEEQIMEARAYLRNPSYPLFAPVGAGMVLRRAALKSWIDTALESPVTDRCGNSLSSAGDCDIVLHVLESGYDIGYFPCLSLTHIIPAFRIKQAYLESISRHAYRDFIRVLDLHGIRPWKAIPTWSVALRTLKAWFSYKVWKTPKARVQWQGAIGQYEGRASLSR